MHSRIFQLSEEPLEKYEYITEDDYCDHWFTREIADYVSDSNREDDIEWLKGHSGFVIESDEHGEYLKVTSKEEYFRNSFEKFTEYLNGLQGCTIDKFINGIAEDMWRLKDAYEDKFGFYVECSVCSLAPMDKFMRCCKENVKYYIGNSLDYHW